MRSAAISGPPSPVSDGSPPRIACASLARVQCQPVVIPHVGQRDEVIDRRGRLLGIKFDDDVALCGLECSLMYTWLESIARSGASANRLARGVVPVSANGRSPALSITGLGPRSNSFVIAVGVLSGQPLVGLLMM